MASAARTGQKISHYRIEKLLGSGGMGVVYRGADLRLGRPVAMKFLRPLSDPSMRRRLIREAQAASSLDHPNICTIFDADETEDGEIFLVMAYYDGETLDRLLAGGSLDVGRALSIAVQTGRGLAAAHEELIVHRDVKPANLMIAPGDTVKILDFGTALLMGDAMTTLDGSVAGTPSYMSPEQLRGDPVDQRTDIWSLGTVLHEMLAGRAPFGGENVAAVIRSILNDRPAPVSSLRTGISPALDPIIQKALAKDQHLRYQQIDEMVNELLLVQSALDSGTALRLPTAAAKSSMAVLPFEDMSAAKDQEFLCDGIAEEIMRALSRIPDLFVASRTSAFQFKGRAADIREIGRRLNVQCVLEGSVRRAEDRVRISAQLVSVDSGYRLWSKSYDRYIEDIFAIEDEIAEQIARALEVRLVDAMEDSAERSSPNAQAYELYLQGRRFFHQHRRKTFEIALQLFSNAIEIDPQYARAYAGIADCHSFLNLYFGKGAEAVAAADAASRKALEIAPNLADAHASRGLALFLCRQFKESERELDRAIELDPNLYYPHYIFGRVCFSQGRQAEAAAHFRQACAIVPEAYDSWYLLGMCLRRMGETAKARTADLECIEAVKKRVRHHPDDTRAWTMGAGVLAQMGEPESADQWIARALAIDADEAIIQYNAACVYVALKKHDEAIACLEAAFQVGGMAMDWMTNDPDLDPLRDDPRFQQLVQGAESPSPNSS